MSLPEPLGSIYESTARVWGQYWVEAAQRQATGKATLCAYVSTIDRCIAVNKELVTAMMAGSKVSCDDIVNDRVAKSPPVSQAATLEDVTRALLWSLEHKGGRISISNPDVSDWLSGLLGEFGGEERLGGAPGSMIDTLTRHCGEPSATVFTVWHSKKQAGRYEPGIQFLTADPPCDLGRVDARTYHKTRARSAGRPRRAQLLPGMAAQPELFLGPEMS